MDGVGRVYVCGEFHDRVWGDVVVSTEGQKKEQPLIVSHIPLPCSWAFGVHWWAQSSSHLSTSHHQSLCGQESALHQSRLGTLHWPDPEGHSLSR